MSVIARQIPAVLLLSPRGDASPIHKGMAVYTSTMAGAAWLLPAGATSLLSRCAAAALYFVLFLVAVLPLLLGVGVPANKLCPSYRQRKSGLVPVGTNPMPRRTSCRTQDSPSSP